MKKRHTTKKKITGQRHHTSNIRKQCLRTARYSNPLKQREERHADRRNAMLNRQVSHRKHAVPDRGPTKDKSLHHTTFVAGKKTIKKQQEEANPRWQIYIYIFYF